MQAILLSSEEVAKRAYRKWWEITATSDINQKVKNRKNNEKKFSKHIDNNAYLIDFGDLGKLIYAHSSGFTNKVEVYSVDNPYSEYKTAAIRMVHPQTK